MTEVRRFGDPSMDMGLQRGDRHAAGQDMTQRDALRGEAGGRRMQAETSAEREMRDRAHAFARALDREVGQEGEGAGGDGRTLLFSLDRPVSAFALFSAEAAAPRETQRADGEDRVARLATQIETAALAELRTGAPGQTRIALPLDAEGLRSVVLVMTKDGIDVTLVQAVGGSPLVLPDAARDLAERLQNRLGGRKVRIFEETAGAARAGIGDGMPRPPRAIDEGESA